METFYIDDKPLFRGKIESLEYQPNTSPLDLIDRSYLSNREPERSLTLRITDAVINDNIIKLTSNSKKTIDPYIDTISFNQTIIPNRKHHKKRIQKKWLKKYGYKTEEDVYKIKNISQTLSDSEIMNFNAELEFLERRIR